MKLLDIIHKIKIIVIIMWRHAVEKLVESMWYNPGSRMFESR
jgi:hypothetical protein